MNIVGRAVVVDPPRLFTFGCYAPLHTRPRDPYSAPELEPDGEYVRAGNVDGAPKFTSLQFTHLLSMRAL